MKGVTEMTATVHYTDQVGVRRWQGGFQPQEIEESYEIIEMDGEIPGELCGTYYRNGPQQSTRKGPLMRHWFDGDGMVQAVRFRDGRAWYLNRFVRTRKFVDEERAGKLLYPSFATPGPSFRRRFLRPPVNPANTNILSHGGRLLALCDAGLPMEMNPETLETLGEFNHGGAMSRWSAATAHPKVDGRTGDLVTFGLQFSLFPRVNHLIVSPSGEVRGQGQVRLPFFSAMHDFAVTENYIVYFAFPLRVRPLGVALGTRTILESLTWEPKRGTEVIVVGRGNGSVRRFKMDPFFFFHTVNAFEKEGEIVVDLHRLSDPDVLFNMSRYMSGGMDGAPDPVLTRFRIPLEGGDVREERLHDRGAEFGRVHPGRVGYPTRYHTCLVRDEGGSNPFEKVARFDSLRGDYELANSEAGGIPGEPVFVPRPGGTEETDGWILTFVYDPDLHRSRVDILDGREFDAGPVCRLHLRGHVSYGFHGNFEPEGQ